MAASYHVTPRICGKPEKPSNCGSGLGQRLDALLLKDTTNLSEKQPAAEANAGIPGPERQQKVAVIGGGISGLRAAAVLQRHGVNVVVLEARDRLGGRIHTSRKADGTALDIGTSRKVVADTELQTCVGSLAVVRLRVCHQKRSLAPSPPGYP